MDRLEAPPPPEATSVAVTRRNLPVDGLPIDGSAEKTMPQHRRAIALSAVGHFFFLLIFSSFFFFSVVSCLLYAPGCRQLDTGTIFVVRGSQKKKDSRHSSRAIKTATCQVPGTVCSDFFYNVSDEKVLQVNANSLRGAKSGLDIDPLVVFPSPIGTTRNPGHNKLRCKTTQHCNNTI